MTRADRNDPPSGMDPPSGIDPPESGSFQSNYRHHHRNKSSPFEKSSRPHTASHAFSSDSPSFQEPISKSAPPSSPASPASPQSSSSKESPESSSSAPSADSKEQLEETQSCSEKDLEADQALARELVPKLAARAYHLQEDNTWCQDWIQYQRNTHPVFGVCFHHPLHPVRGPQRAIILIGSIAFGLAITNVVYLGFLGSDAAGSAVNFIYNATGTIATVQEGYTNVELQQSMVFLWTVGSFLHSSFDMLIWHMTACACFRPGGKCINSHFFQNFGVYLSVMTVACCVFIATSVVVFRFDAEERVAERAAVSEQITQETSFAASSAENDLNNSTLDTTVSGFKGKSELDEVIYESTEKFSFLVGYSVELVFALFVFYPLTSTVYFSGIFGCGRIPILGGRPYEVKKAKEKKEQKMRKQSDDEEQQEQINTWEL